MPIKLLLAVLLVLPALAAAIGGAAAARAMNYIEPPMLEARV